MPDLDVRLYFSDIQDSGKAIVEYISGLSYEEFCEDRKTYSAVIREFEIIGEAVNKISDDIKQYHQNVQWKDIKDFRNLLIHEYFGVDLEIVWNIIQDDLPLLLEAVRVQLSQFNST